MKVQVKSLFPANVMPHLLEARRCITEALELPDGAIEVKEEGPMVAVYANTDTSTLVNFYTMYGILAGQAEAEDDLNLTKQFLQDYVAEFESSGTVGWERYDKAKKVLESLQEPTSTQKHNQ